MLNSLKRIIEHMKKIYNMYRLVKLVDTLVEEREILHPTPLKNSGVDIWHPGTAYVKGVLVTRCKYIKITHKQATDAVADCLSKKNKYLHEYSQNHNGTDVDVICIIENGRELIDTVPGLPFLKIGLYEALWAKHGKIITGIIGFLIGSIPTIVWMIKRIIVS